MNAVDRDKLRALAALATDGPWMRDIAPGRQGDIITGWQSDNGEHLFVASSSDEDTAFISAANPKVVLALLDALAAAEARADRAESDLRTAPFPCCMHCPEDDPEYHEENPRDSHETSCSTCDDGMRMRAEKAEAKLAALRARPTLDREALILALEEDKNWPGGEAEPKFQADSVLTLLAAVGQDTPATEGALPEWTDPQPWVNPVTGARDEAEWDGVVGAPIYSPRTREQYDAE